MTVDTTGATSAAERPTPAPDHLAAVKEALLRRARDDAAELLGAADDEVDALLSAARERGSALRAAARTEGATDAEAVVAAELTRARRDARATLLAARREGYEELRARVHEGLGELRKEPEHAELVERLTDRARKALGPDAVVTEDPAGGVVAEAGGRRMALTLPALADRVLDDLGPEIEELWRP